MIFAFLTAALFLAVVLPIAEAETILLRIGLHVPPRVARPIAYGTALATVVFALHVTALLLPFRTAVLVTTTTLPVLGLALLARPLASLVPAVPTILREHWRRAAGFFAAGVAATLFLWPTWSWWDFHDTFTAISGHAGISLEMVNGVYPPRNLSLPSEPLIYHYAVDLFFAAGATLTDFRIDRVVDGVALALWFLTLGTAYLLGRALWSARAGVAGAVLLAGSGGFPWVWSGIEHALHIGEKPQAGEAASAFQWMESLFLYHTGGGSDYSVDRPFVSNFFQYPWALATPLLLAMVALVSVFSESPRPVPPAVRIVRTSVLLALVAALAFSETAAFFTVLVAIGVVAVALAVQRRAIATTSVDLTAVVVAGALCALTLPGPAGVTFRSILHKLPGLATIVSAPVVDSANTIHLVHVDASVLAGKIGWNIGSFGFLLAGLWVLFRPDVRSTSWGLFALATIFAGALIANVFYYGLSWDIVKFATPAQIVLAIAVAGLFADGRGHLRSRSGALTVGVAAGVCVAGLLHQLAYFLIPGGAISSRNGLLHQVSRDELASIEWLRSRVRAGQAVACSPDIDLACADLGGLPQIRLDALGATQLLPSVATARLAALQGAPAVTRAMARDYHLCWLISSPGRTMPVRGLTQLASRSPTVFRSGRVRVVSLC